MANQDLSRALLQPRKHYVAARLQQGRILVDSDFNDGAELADEELRQTVLDLVGPEGSGDAGFSVGQPFPTTGPRPAQTPDLRTGDEVDVAKVILDGQPTIIHPVTVRAGSLYLGGLRFEQEVAEQIAFQRDFLQLTPAGMPNIAPGTTDLGNVTNAPAFNLYYLHAWEQAVGSVEDAEIGETMLEGPDTSVRVRRMRRVEVYDVLHAPDVASIESDEQAFQSLINNVFVPDNATFDGETSALVSNGRLQITFAPGASDDTCAPCAASQLRYLGDENVALRIMQTDTSHFVWSLSNAAPMFRVTVDGLDTAGATTLTVTMLTPPRSETELPLVNQVIELLPFGALLDGGDLPPATRTPHARKVASEVGAFGRVLTSFDADTQSFTVDFSTTNAPRFRAAMDSFVRVWDPAHPDAAVLNDPAQPQGTNAFFLRLWHVAMQPQDVELPLNTNVGGPSLGDTGVVPVFHTAGRRGDFWIATLRVDRPGVVVPFDLGTAVAGVPPHGPRRFIQRLALVTINEETVPQPSPPHPAPVVTETSDTRPRIRRVTDDTCITATVGDGVNSIGDYPSIQAAIHALPSAGGRIAVHPGQYHEEIQIAGRRNVSIEGCGDATVIETPAFSNAELITISQSSGITISGLTLNPLDQRAILIADSTDVSIGDIAATSGVVTPRQTFSPGARVSGIPLVDVERSSNVNLRSLILEGFQRPALQIQNCEVVTLREISAFGSKVDGQVPILPLVSLISSALVKMSDSRLSAFGQVALDLSGAGTQDIDLTNLSIDVGAFEPTDNLDGVLESRSGVDVESGDRIRLQDSRISMEASSSDAAAVVVKANDVVISGNSFEALRDPDPTKIDNLAWGGLQIRGGSTRVQVLRNHVIGGIGHGITLGSVLWRPNSSPVQSPKGPPETKAVRREGAGRGQIAPQTGTVAAGAPRIVLNADIGAGFADEDGHDFSPVNEGPVVDLTISGNRIEEMRSNGISAITVLGLRNLGGDLVEVEQARIERNVIVNNVQAPGASLPLTSELFPFSASREGAGVPLPALAFGGIVLASASGGIDIRDNVIVGNGSSPVVPISGIFLLTGDAVSITGNRVSDNGALALAPATGNPNNLLAGVRAGVAVMLAGVAAGSLDDVSPVFSGRIVPDAEGSSLRIVGNTISQNEGRALHAVATGPVTVDGNFLLSHGYHGAETVNDRFAIGDVVFIQDLGAPCEQFDITRIASRDLLDSTRPTEFQDFIAPHGTQPFLLNLSPPGPRSFMGEGGSVLFTNNQVTYDWTVARTPAPTSAAPLSFFPLAIIGLDHVGVMGNQLAVRLDVSQLSSDQLTDLERRRALPIVADDELILSQLFIIGTTVNVSGNRCSSGFHLEPSITGPVPNSVLSILTFGETLSSLAINQTSNIIVGFTARTPASILSSGLPADDPTVLTDREEEGNLVLFPRPDLTTFIKTLKRIQEEFMRLISTGSPQDNNDLEIVTLLPADDFRENQTITVIGRNFGVKTATTQITIGNVKVRPEQIDFPDSSDTQLIFTVPPLGPLPSSGTLFPLTISNGQTSDAVVRRFLPILLPLTGDVRVRLVAASPSPLAPGQSMFFQFNLVSNASANATFAISTVLGSPPGETPWRATVTDADRVPIPSNQINTDPGTVTFFVQVDPTSNVANDFFTLAVNATAFPLAGGTGLLGFTTGQTFTPPDGTITLDLVETDLAPGVAFDGATISSPVGQISSFVFLAHFTNAGSFGQQILQSGGAAGWNPTFTAGLPNPTPANTTRSLGFNVNPSATAVGGFIQFEITDLATNNVLQSALFAVKLIAQ